MINPATFIQDFRKLFTESPQCGSWTRASENCSYGDLTTVSKDCYMCFNSGNCRNAYYCEDSRALTDSTDCGFCEKCELIYECIDCDSCYGSNFCQDCANCDDVHFSYDLRRCKHCVGCAGLRDKEYHIFNEKYSKEDYAEAIKKFDISDPKIIETTNQKLEELKKTIPRMFVHQYDTTDCTGDYVYHSKNCHMCFDTRHTEDSGYIIQANLDMGTKDSYDCGPVPTGMDLCYDIAYSHYLFNCNHLYWCGNIKDSEFCCNCFESEHLFGCHYLKNKQKSFYILNQEVTEDQYKNLVPQIKKVIKENGIFTLHDLLHKELSIKEDLIDDKITHRNCTLCNAEFDLIEDEIKFYKKRDLQFPIYCPGCRADQRIRLRNKRAMYKRKCDGCKETLISTFKKDSPYIVYCLECYWKHIN